MAPVTVSIEIDRTAPAVFTYATDATRFRDWQDGVVDGHREGDRCLTTRRIGGITRSVTSKVTHDDPPHTWGVRGTDGPLRAAVDLAFLRRGVTFTVERGMRIEDIGLVEKRGGKSGDWRAAEK